MTVKKKESVAAQKANSAKNLIKTKIIPISPEFIPKYKTNGSACADLVANTNQKIRLLPGTTVLVDCGFKMQLPFGYEAQIRARSSFAKKGLIVTNSPGTIDCDYCGELKVVVTNVGKEILEIDHLTRFAQMALKPVWQFDWEVVDHLENTERGEGGFGSTGEK